MRLFFALWPDDAVRAELARWSRELHALCGGRITPPEKLHVTLLRDAREPAAMPALGPIEWRLDGFALVQSVSLPQRSRYEIRKSWKGRA